MHLSKPSYVRRRMDVVALRGALESFADAMHARAFLPTNFRSPGDHEERVSLCSYVVDTPPAPVSSRVSFHST